MRVICTAIKGRMKNRLSGTTRSQRKLLEPEKPSNCQIHRPSAPHFVCSASAKEGEARAASVVPAATAKAGDLLKRYGAQRSRSRLREGLETCECYTTG